MRLTVNGEDRVFKAVADIAALVAAIGLDPRKVAVERNLAIARASGARIEILDGQDPIETLLKFAHQHGVTQIFVGHSTREQWWERFTGTPLDRLIRGANVALQLKTAS